VAITHHTTQIWRMRASKCKLRPIWASKTSKLLQVPVLAGLPMIMMMAMIIAQMIMITIMRTAKRGRYRGGRGVVAVAAEAWCDKAKTVC
jgi:hypothetical protein